MTWIRRLSDTDTDQPRPQQPVLRDDLTDEIEKNRQCLVESVIASSIDDHGIVEIPNTFAEKFAQLIVEECIKLNGKELAMAGHSRMVDVYCEHFGIEYK